MPGSKAQDVSLGPTRVNVSATNVTSATSPARAPASGSCSRVPRRMPTERTAQSLAVLSITSNKSPASAKKHSPVRRDWLEAEHVGELAAPVLVAADVRRRTASTNGLPPPHVSGYDAAAARLAARSCHLPRARAAHRKMATGPMRRGHRKPFHADRRKSFRSRTANRPSAPWRILPRARSSFFAARGLRLQERKEFQFDDRDKGSFQHEALQRISRASPAPRVASGVTSPRPKRPARRGNRPRNC